MLSRQAEFVALPVQLMFAQVAAGVDLADQHGCKGRGRAGQR